MRFTAAFFRLVRLPNLLFIALTQGLFYFCILLPLVERTGHSPSLTQPYLWLLMLASVFIAAAGYIINDYFDINIDEVNKPEKNVVDHIISRRWAMLLHLLLSSAGLMLSLYVSWKSGSWYIVFVNFLCIGLLFGYSASLKRKLLSGNVLISLLTAWVILVLCFTETRPLVFADVPAVSMQAASKIFRLGVLYAGFAFISSLIREAIKDMEDREGDARYGCRTMPIVWGLNATKVYVAVWLVVLIAVLVIVQLYVLQFRWWLPAAYSILLIILPLVYIFTRLFQAVKTADFRKLSRLIKTVMLTGILSMVFFYYYL